MTNTVFPYTCFKNFLNSVRRRLNLTADSMNFPDDEFDFRSICAFESIIIHRNFIQFSKCHFGAPIRKLSLLKKGWASRAGYFFFVFRPMCLLLTSNTTF